jgi:uncharacterized protein
MTEEGSGPSESISPERRWQPLRAVDRRVVGVLAEKAKTTPDIYPMSLSAVSTGCNQKSNRAPQMQLEPADVEDALDRLRELGAVGLVEGYGRVAKYRHYLYEWLGVDKVELAVMTELLLRGEQTVGELRGRAARMEPISDLAALLPVLESLKTKGLVIALTSEGRGQVVSHALYQPAEIEALKSRFVSAPAPSARAPRDFVAAAADAESIELLRQELPALREQVAELRRELEEIRVEQSQTSSELLRLKQSLGDI